MERAIRVRIDREFHLLAHGHLTDICLIDQKLDAHGRKIRDCHDDHLARQPLRHRLPFLHRLSDDYAIHRRCDDRIIHIRLRLVIRRLCIQIVHARIVHLLIRDRAFRIKACQTFIVGLLIGERILRLLHHGRQRLRLDHRQRLTLRDLFILLHIHLFQSAGRRRREIDTVHRLDRSRRIDGKPDSSARYRPHRVIILLRSMALLIPEITAARCHCDDNEENDHPFLLHIFPPYGFINSQGILHAKSILS